MSRWLWGLFFAALLLAGCGGGSGGPSTGSALTFDQRQAAFDALATETATLTASNFVSETPRLLGFLSGRPEFQDAFVEPADPLTIWAQFTDGRWLVISRNREPEAVSPSLGRGRDGELPGPQLIPNGKAAFFFSFSETGFTDITLEAVPAFSAAGFQIAPGRAGTLEDYRALNDVGLLYIDSHGYAQTRKGQPLRVGLQSATRVLKDQEGVYAADLAAERLYYVLPPKANRPVELGFFPEWVRANVQLPGRALVFANTCNSQANSSMADAFVAKGAAAFIGWTQPVGDIHAGETGRALLDQLLGRPQLFTYGSGLAEPEVPVDWTEAVARMRGAARPPGRQNRGLNLDQSIMQCVLRTTGVNGALGPARPRIDRVILSEGNNRMFLVGTFGLTPGTVQGNPGGRALPVLNWRPTEIELAYNGSVTQAQVTVNGVTSNVFDFPSGNYRISGPGDTPFALRDQITVWVGDQQVYSASGSSAQPFSFSARAGQQLRIRVTSSSNFGGTGEMVIRSPLTPTYRIRPNALDLLVSAGGVVFDQTFTLQP